MDTIFMDYDLVQNEKILSLTCFGKMFTNIETSFAFSEQSYLCHQNCEKSIPIAQHIYFKLIC